MKPTSTMDIRHEGSLSQVDRVQMTFDQNALVHLMSVLTDLYSDPMLAVIREYSTNAFDSHREANNDDPIEIELPSSLNPVFVVRDRGVGMSVDEVINQFSKYGFSSKRETDEQVGMLGLGCKSALTYTSQFTLVIRKDGIEAMVLVTRDEQGAGALQIVDTNETKEPNGVEVRIPVKHVMDFNNRAHRFFRFWDPGTVLINGEEPDFVGRHESDIKLDSDIILTNSIEQDYVIMGNVPYPVQTTHSLFKDYRYHVMARVPIGSVNFTPSREALQYTKKTKDTLDEIRDFVRTTVQKRGQEEIDACKTHKEALEVGTRWRALTKTNYTYKGSPIPVSFHPTDKDRTFIWEVGVHYRDASTPARRKQYQLTPQEMMNAMHIVGHKAQSISAPFKHRILKYLEEKKLDKVGTILAYPEPFGGDWASDVLTVDADVIRAIKLPSQTRAKPQGTKYKLLNQWGSTTETYDMPKGTMVVVLAGLAKNEQRERMGRWAAGQKDIEVVLVTIGREDKFLADHKKAIMADKFFEKRIKEYADSLTPYERYTLGAYGRYSSIPQTLLSESAKILDPNLKSLLKGIANSRNTAPEWNSLTAVARNFGVAVPDTSTPATKAVEKEVASLQQDYPLLFRTQTADSKHLVDYVNATYFYRTNSKTSK